MALSSRGLVVTAWLGGVLLAGCGSAAAPAPAPAPGSRGQFVSCTGAGKAPAGYAILDSPGPDCKPLVVGEDYADGRVIVGLKPGTGDAQLGPALTAYSATVISSQPSLGDRVLSVPKGTVPEAVVGLARYPFVLFAAPDLLAHTGFNT